MNIIYERHNERPTVLIGPSFQKLCVMPCVIERVALQSSAYQVQWPSLRLTLTAMQGRVLDFFHWKRIHVFAKWTMELQLKSNMIMPALAAYA